MSKSREATDAEFMANPDNWPNLLLPVKRWKNGDMDCAFLTGSGPRLYLANVFALNDMSDEERLAIKTQEYPSFDAIIADGWRVD